MQPIRIVKSDVFRFTALFAFLFLSFTALLIATVLFIVERTQRAALTGANDADIATVTNGFRDEGLPEAIEVVRQRLGPIQGNRYVPPDCYMVIENAQGEKLAGNLPAITPHLGETALTLPDVADYPPSATGRPRVILGRGLHLTDGAYLFVGRDTALLAATRERILYAFMWVALGAVVLAVAGGLVLGNRFMRRVDSITGTCHAIIAGRWEQRIPVLGREDEWDRLAAAINEMLNRISALLDNLRQVSSDVAHDLRTPLTRMRNRLEEARMKAGSIPEYSAAVATAIDDTDQLLAMFAALLRISQVEAGTRLGSFSSVPLTEIVERICQLYVPVAEDYQHGLQSEFERNLFVHGDAELLTQMFSNLLENAIKHTPDDTRIDLTLRSEDGRVVFCIADDGPGIDPCEYQRVLTRFYRLSRSRSSPGHGLGLALVAAIAELHHAELTLSSATPGLRVTLRFPEDGNG